MADVKQFLLALRTAGSMHVGKTQKIHQGLEQEVKMVAFCCSMVLI